MRQAKPDRIVPTFIIKLVERLNSGTLSVLRIGPDGVIAFPRNAGDPLNDHDKVALNYAGALEVRMSITQKPFSWSWNNGEPQVSVGGASITGYVPARVERLCDGLHMVGDLYPDANADQTMWVIGEDGAAAHPGAGLRIWAATLGECIARYAAIRRPKFGEDPLGTLSKMRENARDIDIRTGHTWTRHNVSIGIEDAVRRAREMHNENARAKR